MMIEYGIASILVVAVVLAVSWVADRVQEAAKLREENKKLRKWLSEAEREAAEREAG